MSLMTELLALEGKKPKCTCEDDPKKCKMHMDKVAEEHEDQDHVDDPNPISNVHAKADEYEGSVDFTEDLHKAQQLLDQFDKIVSAEKFSKWMKVTDQNFGTSCVDAYGEMMGNLRHLHDAWNDIGDELDNAQ